ncbi:hypothetical protein M407DRAFT_11453 [Tulasnella calospora MUT 4182]|uniref:Uncharacterized protein n=1 Tax=Tulasnella calospora MUT 4182 TaxID=1051891 RepID=A0A0C3LD29_9AGAM|nr:hypothetical protein M407DRAFT_11453 [Tulasnella calospora MUT 4182]
MAPIREIISKMKLTSLQTFVSMPFSHRRSGQSEAETIFGNLRMTLQGQPMLRDLNFEYPEFPGNVRNGIEISDIPSLQTLQADPLTVARILPVAARDQLKSVEVLGWTKIWTGFLVSSFSRLTEARQKVRKLELWMEWDLERGWDFDFGQVLEMFPNTDSLRIKGLSSEPDKDDIELMDAFLEKVSDKNPFSAVDLPNILRIFSFSWQNQVASQITQSLKLTTIEVSLRITNMWRSDCVNDVTEELKLRLKSSCPSLKTFIDPARQEWAFLSCEEEERSNDFRVVNVGRVCRGFKYSSDLEALEGGSVDLISD